MTERHVRLETLRCRRTGEMYSVDEHEQCPYCSADAEAIRKSGKHEDFCDFCPGTDPVSFGFPSDTSRNVRR
ncbi:MAG: hypothetical protein KC776_01910 [Myxococcales bacterium]|nr:hypothetical protein [Myxococcales bacterium]MCB9579505.1 hypothetical protein [Polyangiaceae bacterium]